jgi:cell division septal protein FtsQ
MGSYQGRALERTPRRGGGRGPDGRVIGAIAAVVLVVAGLALLPWRTLRHRYAVLTDVKVSGLRYLDAPRVLEDARLRLGQDLPSLDLSRVRQLVMMDPRIERAEVSRRGLRGLQVSVVERVPALAVTHGEPWEIDTSGVLLEPLQPGVVADVPMLTGADFSAWRPGSQVRTSQVQRGLAWAAILGDNALRLAGQVSEVDVSQERSTRLVLMNGISVIGPAWPADMRQLSGLRATLADLGRKGMMPGEVDVRFPDQIIVRDARPAAAVPPAGTS